MLTSRRMTGSFSVSCMTTSEITASGTQAKKHQRQPSQSVSTISPPSSGPATVATDMTAAIGPL